MFAQVAAASLDVARRAAPLVPVWFCIDQYVGSVKLVGGSSMQPTFNGRGRQYNDAVLLDRWTARNLNYARGDVVVLRSPHAPNEMLTKRVIGLPGDWVRPRVAAAQLRRAQGIGPQDEDADVFSESTVKRAGALGSGVVHVPRGQLWVEGDNEASSNDSNGFGCVSAALVEARVCYKLWPPSEAGVVTRVEPRTDRLVHRGSCEKMSRCVAEQKGVMPWHVSR